MQLKTLFSAAALLSTAWAQIAFTNYPFPTNFVAGQSYTLTWSGETAGQPVTILLRQGDPGNLSPGTTLTSSATGGSYVFTPSTSIVNGGNYAFEIQQAGQQPNYSQQFSITGGLTSSAASLVSSASSAVSSASSAASSLVSSILSSASSVAANATMSTHSSSASATSSTASRTGSATSSTAAAAPSTGTNAGNNIQSPVALILGAVAAMAYLA